MATVLKVDQAFEDFQAGRASLEELAAVVYRYGVIYTRMKFGAPDEDIANSVAFSTTTGEFRGRAKFSTYVMQALMNACINEVQRGRPAEVVSLETGTYEEPTVDSQAEVRMLLESYLSILTPREREYIEVAFLGAEPVLTKGEDYGEVTIRKRLSRALMRMRAKAQGKIWNGSVLKERGE